MVRTGEYTRGGIVKCNVDAEDSREKRLGG